MKMSIKDIDLTGKRIFLRADFNVPIVNKTITDNYRIRMTLPTINYLLDNNVKSILIASHLGRPKIFSKDLQLKVVYNELAKVFEERHLRLEYKVFYDEPAQYTLFENIRFLKEEESCSDLDRFQAYLNHYADLLVIDAFGVVHRRAASLTETKLKAYAGLLVQKELEVMSMFEKKFDLIILGGKKVDDKILLVKNCIKKCKKIYIGGGMCKPFIEGTLNKEVDEIRNVAKEFGTDIILPRDFIIIDNGKSSNSEKYRNDFVDIGQKSTSELCQLIKEAKSVFWNGPVGIFEKEESCKGTKAVVEILKNTDISIIGGGDTASAVRKFGNTEDFTHVSTGGGSLLALIEGQKLPGIDIIENK